MIANVQIIGIHGDQNIDQDLVSGLNILHAKNGAGKTTFLHVIANLFKHDIERFCHLHFSRIVLKTTDETIITLRQRRNNGKAEVVVEVNGNELGWIKAGKRVEPSLDQLLFEKLGGRPVYLPAFRSILEGAQDSTYSSSAFRSGKDSEEFQELVRRERVARRTALRGMEGYSLRDVESVAIKTMLCRGWFGEFVPVIRYPSLADVDKSLSREVRHAYFAVSRTDQRILYDTFLKVFDAIVNKQDASAGLDTTTLLNHLVTHLDALNRASLIGSEVYSQLEQRLRSQAVVSIPDEDKIRLILSIYDNALGGRGKAENEAFAGIQRFINSVNTFLSDSDKKLKFRNELAETPGSESALHVQLQNKRDVSLRVLSSGERHVLTLLYSATHMSNEDGIVLIDEPELSLHVDWQRIILGELMKQVGTRQVIACTHSPEIAADHLNFTRELTLFSRLRSNTSDGPDDEDHMSTGPDNLTSDGV